MSSANATSATVVIGGPRATSTERWAGTTRYGTSARIATTAYPADASTVFLASGADFPDALAGSPVAGVRGAPMLLTNPDQLSGPTRGALSTLGARTVIILGGTTAVSANVQDELTALGLTVQRWAGANRYGTAVEISQRAFPGGPTACMWRPGPSSPTRSPGRPRQGPRGARCCWSPARRSGRRSWRR